MSAACSIPPASANWVSARISWPIFHGGQIHANIRAREEEEKQAYYAYQKAVLGGIQNAEDALARYQTEQQRYVTLDGAAQTARQSTALALQQYKVGLTPYINVLQTQSTQLTAQDNLAQSRAALTADLVSLYKALGGGWKDDGDKAAKPETAVRLPSVNVSGWCAALERISS